MEKFDKKDRVLIGITLFSMFFGAGNLIFPPFLGAQAGSKMPEAFLGFAVSAVFLPILGVVAVTKSGGLEELASRVHPKFSYFYIMILYLAIGPFLAIPRTAGTSFSIAVLPFWNGTGTVWLVQLLYSLVFFAAAAQIALHPERLTEYLGKRLTPILLALIIVIFAASLLYPAGGAKNPAEMYQNLPVVSGFLEGYQTMDTLAALNFGMIIAMNIQAKGVKNKKSVMKETVNAGWIAGIVLLLVYGMLSYIGMSFGGRFPGSSNGTEILTGTVTVLFGKAGLVILAVIFVIACFNTCVGLFSCCGNYFHKIFPKVSYKKWVYLFAVVSMVISNIGLNQILEFSVPILHMLYPLAIVLIFLACVHQWIAECPLVYPCSMLLCGISSFVTVLDRKGLVFPVITRGMRMIPGYEMGFGWVIPSVMGIVLGIVLKIRMRCPGDAGQTAEERK